jgi:hypothetical protein
MATYADLGPCGLLPSAVLRCVQEHASYRPPENILFKVTNEVVELYARNLPKAVAVSRQGADKTNAFLVPIWSAYECTLTSRVLCSNCGRILTFYDVLESGRKRHGDAHSQRFLGDGEYHIQIAAKKAKH